LSGLPTLGPRGEGWVAIQFVLLGLVAAAGLVGPAWGGVTSTVTTPIGLIAMVAGGALGAWGLVGLRDALTPLPHPRDGATLVESGAYRLVRHPIYGGIVIGTAGYGLVTASPIAVAGAAVLLGFFRLKSTREEAWLRSRYPGYLAYASRTRRMLPFLY
jgi:protein-S-isoprenylcysteine O-methyltransferase Ste14